MISKALSDVCYYIISIMALFVILMVFDLAQVYLNLLAIFNYGGIDAKL